MPFSHEQHVRQNGIDCRYCHSSVEAGPFAGMPSSETCMTCHSQVWSESAMLAPVRESLRGGRPIAWVRVHDLPDFVYFDHGVHVRKGIGCSTCHGRVDAMPLTWREPQHWRSLEELAGGAAYQAGLKDEFPPASLPSGRDWNRRDFLKLVGSALALAGTSCARQPLEKIVPYVRAPEELVPGQPLFYATASVLGGSARGILVESHLGLPAKVEGNPDHPESLGATDAFAQASIFSLYDPERSQVPQKRGQIATWNEFWADLRRELEKQAARKGAGLRLLTERVVSPTLADQIERLLQKFPAARWHSYEPALGDGERAGSVLAFGRSAHPVYRFAQANVVLALDADFLSLTPGHLRYARDFARRRSADSRKLNRLYCAESTPTLAGARADHRLPLRAAAG